MANGGNNFIPRPDGDFDSWLDQFIAGCANWWDSHGGDGPLDPLRDLRDQWDKFYALSVAADAAARAATSAKSAARAACEQEARALVRLVQGTGDTTDAQRADMGISLRDGPVLRTGSSPTSRPIAIVDLPARLTHKLRIVNASATHGSESRATRKARPRGTLGAEVYLALTAPTTPAPTDINSYRFIALATASTLAHTFDSADGGKTAHYQLRWLGTRGEHGPWSEIASATIAA